MQTKGTFMTRYLFLAAIFAVALNGAPSIAAESAPAANTELAAANTNINLESPAALTATKSDGAAADMANDLHESSVPPVADSSLTNAPAPMMGAGNGFADSLPNFGPSSGTVVGNRAAELRDDVLRLRASVNLNSSEFSVLRSSGAAGAVQYHSTVAAITARLQNGTTRGNPILLRQWTEANSSLDEVTTSLARLNSLSTSVESDGSTAAYLMDSVQAAFQLSGAIDEDHDQLKLLRDELSRLVVQVDYLRNQTTNDIERQTTYLTTERSNLQTLAFAISRGELLGNSVANRPVIVNSALFASLPPQPPQQPASPPMMAGTPAPPVTGMPVPPQPAPMVPVAAAAPSAPPHVAPQADGAGGGAVSAADFAPSLGQLLVLIRYDQPNIDYQQQLAQAVGRILERRPNAEFAVLAVAPSIGNPSDLAKQQQLAQAYADAVKRSLVQLGLAQSRITMSSTQMPSAQVPEVHIYVR